MKNHLLLFILLLAISKLSAQEQSWQYFGQKPPGLKPEVFAPGIISGKVRLHCFPSFSSDGKEVVWMTLPPKMWHACFDGKWTESEQVAISKKYRCMFPFFSYDNKNLYFSSNNIPGGFGSVDIWYVEKLDTGYSKPINMGTPVNSKQFESQVVFAKSGNLYYTGHVPGKRWNRGIMRSRFENGSFQSPEILGEPINIIDSNVVDYTPFIAQDESYLLFSSNRHDPGQEECRIYISFRNENDEWDTPRNINNIIGFDSDSRNPYVSTDEKYLFYCSGLNIYWISSEILYKIRQKEN